MNDYSEDIEILLDELKDIIKDPVLFEIKKQNFINWFQTVIEEVYQEGILEGLDRDWK
jgi:hypothetical protein